LTFFTIQLGAFASPAHLEPLPKRLEEKGYPVYVVDVRKADGSTLFKLRMGHYASLAEAKAAGVELQRREQVNYFIVKSDARVVATPPPEPVGSSDLPEAEPVSQPTPVEGTPTRATDRPAGEAAVDRQPQGVTWVYSFRDPKGDLHITNSYGRIPEDLRDAVTRIVIFPVRYLAATARGAGLVLQVGDEQLEMALADVELPAGLLSAPMHDYLDGMLQGELLRLKFNPQQTSPDGLVYGRLYLRDGICVNHDLVRRGLGRCCLENTPPEEHEALRKAEERARSEKVGVWSDTSRN
jgi:hypothetical protein